MSAEPVIVNVVHKPYFNPSSTTLRAHENDGILVFALLPTAVPPFPFRRPFFDDAEVAATVSDAID
jgi:hypothetical protein